MQSIFFEYDFTDLNTYINHERGNKYKGASLKKVNTNYVAWITANNLNARKLEKYSKNDKLEFNFTWYLTNRKRDPDNVAFAKKFIMDGFVSAGLIPNDGAKNVIRFTDDFVYGKILGCLIKIKKAEEI